MDVRKIQLELIALGYDLGPGAADGVLGRMTTMAVAKFQADRKLMISYPGTIGSITLEALGLAKPDSGTFLPWVAEAQRYLGMHEVRNAKMLDRLMRLDTSAIPWCGAFAALVVGATLPREAVPGNPLWARDWLKFGRRVTGVNFGAVCVFSRGKGGHVGFVVGHDKIAVHCLGGNQSNTVSVARVAKSRLLGCRWPTTFDLPARTLPITKFTGRLSTNEA